MSDDWYTGHDAGYEAAEDDLIEYVREFIDEGLGLKVYTHEQLWATRELLAVLEVRQARRTQTEEGDRV